jgi:hypothetical protein
MDEFSAFSISKIGEDVGEKKSSPDFYAVVLVTPIKPCQREAERIRRPVRNLSKHTTKNICIIYLPSNQEIEICSDAIILLEIQIYPCFAWKLDKPFD